MGDRAQIAIKMRDGGAVYLYSHWRGDAVYGSLQTALGRRERWEDPEYLARIIFQTMVGNDHHTTGFGIGTGLHEAIEHPVPVLDCRTQTITWQTPAWAHNAGSKFADCTFENFVIHAQQPKEEPCTE